MYAPLIELEAISKIYQSEEVETHALTAVDLTIEVGEFIAINGPSGCGKSTLLAILGLLEDPSEGTYRFNGRPLQRLGSAERASLRNNEIGFVFQSFNLLDDLTVYENVELPLTYRGMRGRYRREMVDKALATVGLTNRRNHFPVQLSGGQQQRVAIARALAGSPRILLADEPTGNLDSQNGDRVMELFREIHAEGTTICMVTHNPEHREYASRVLELFDGRVRGPVLA